MTELESLKQIADNKGIQYHPSIGLEKLKQKIADFDAGITEEAKEEVVQAAAQTKQQKRMAQRKEMDALVRVRIMCMNPMKREWPGQWLTVGNALIGMQTKFIQFDEPYHITEFMRRTLDSKRFRTSKSVPDGKGGKIRKNIDQKEFNIEILPPLTPEELEALKADQMKRQAID